jgi:nucleotide-binding universal stress UspA family protein
MGEVAVFRTIMVPLDRSPLAEQALPLAHELAWRAGATLDLVTAHALYALQDGNPGRLPYNASEDAEFRQREQLYLNAAGDRLLTHHPVPVRTAVLDGLPADALLKRQDDQPADLIVMTTHGRGPVSRAFLGSVADELIRRAPVPLLLLRPSPEPTSESALPIINHVLITLDGSTLAEGVVPPSLELARLLEARCTLLRVIDSAEPSLDPTTGPWQRAEDAAATYLEAIARRLRECGLCVDVHTVVARHAAAAILEHAHEQPGYLIALATHGRSGVRRALLGSVADKVIRGSALPALVVHPQQGIRS